MDFIMSNLVIHAWRIGIPSLQYWMVDFLYSDVFGLKHHVFLWTMFHGHVTNNQRVMFWVKWRLDEIQWAFHQQSYDMKKINEDFEATVVNPISYFSNKSITGFKGEIDLTNRVMGIITMGKTMGKGWGNPRFFLCLDAWPSPFFTNTPLFYQKLIKAVAAQSEHWHSKLRIILFGIYPLVN